MIRNLLLIFVLLLAARAFLLLVYGFIKTNFLPMGPKYQEDIAKLAIWSGNRESKDVIRLPIFVRNPLCIY